MITMIVGVLIRGQIRKGLEMLKASNEIVSYRETKSLLESKFTVEGATPLAVRQMSSWKRQIEGRDAA
ncbi:hypothetical protein G6L37_34990 [Agrobacterium rubi]|nr:hypothetical protein [Agrobacterium rubi]NTF23776.1 hypothetical protein [Agrobacterium rubi]